MHLLVQMFQTNVAGLLFSNQCWHHGSDTARPAFHDTFIAFGFSDSSPLHYCVSPQGNAHFKGIILLLCFVIPTFLHISLSTSMKYTKHEKKRRRRIRSSERLLNVLCRFTTIIFKHPKIRIRTIAERSVSFSQRLFNACARTQK